MRGGLLPATLLCATFGLAVGFAPRRALAPGIALLAATAVAATLMPTALSTELAFAGCWASLIIVALTVYLPRSLPLRATLALALLAGFWIGAVLHREGRPLDLTRALPFALVGIPARWIIARGGSIGIKVVCSWLIAVALLSALLPTSGTPGYVADHME